MPDQSTLPRTSMLKGCILFLKKADDIERRHLAKYDIEIEALFHPVLVFGNIGNTNDVAICLMTTLNGDNVEDRFSHAFCKYYLPIKPKRPHASSHPQLCLENQRQMRRPGYVNIRKLYRVHRSMLMLYDRHKPADYFRLTRQSHAIVCEKLETKIDMVMGMKCDPRAMSSTERPPAIKIDIRSVTEAGWLTWLFLGAVAGSSTAVNKTGEGLAEASKGLFGLVKSLFEKATG